MGLTELHSIGHLLGTVAFYSFRNAVAIMGLFMFFFAASYFYKRNFLGRPDVAIKMTSDGVFRMVLIASVSASLFLIPLLDGYNFRLGNGNHPPINALQMALFYAFLVMLFMWAASAKKMVFIYSAAVLIPCSIAAVLDVYQGRVSIPGV